MTHALFLKIVLGLMLSMSLAGIVWAHRRGKPLREFLALLPAPGVIFFLQIPSAFGMSSVAGIPFYLTAAACLLIQFRRLVSKTGTDAAG